MRHKWKCILQNGSRETANIVFKWLKLLRLQSIKAKYDILRDKVPSESLPSSLFVDVSLYSKAFGIFCSLLYVYYIHVKYDLICDLVYVMNKIFIIIAELSKLLVMHKI